MTNTKIDYVYADASNYKVWGREVLAGTLTIAEKAEIIDACWDGELFIASQVGLPDLQHQMWNEHRMNEDDHVFHRLSLDAFADTDEESTLELSTGDLLNAFRVVSATMSNGTTTGWNAIAAIERLGLDRGV
jgi:hypothetical protein